MKRYENIENALCREMEKLDKKYAGDVEMSLQDLETVRLLRSAILKGKTIEAMDEDREWDDEDMEGSGRRGNDGRMYSGRSYKRGRDGMGWYPSMDMMPGYSGHYPEYMPPYFGGRR